jgi:transcriptional regulator GlxA family with amidase domain
MVGSRFAVVFALYPRVTQLDFTGPFEVFARLPGAECVLASTEGGTIQADGGLTFARVARLGDLAECALLCVPGGFGCIAAMEDQSYLAELRRLAALSRYVTSVCTGSLLLAAAGLLEGKRAACHWAWRDSLATLGVTADPARVVRDGNVITGGGVTAGIDMALTVTAEIAGIEFAQVVQLAMEYAPQPPFDCGRPDLAPAPIVDAALRRYHSMQVERDSVVQRVTQRLAL